MTHYLEHEASNWLVTEVMFHPCVAMAVVKYDISSVQESAGSPVFKEDTGEVPYMVAIHNGYSETKSHGVNVYMNYGVHLLEILNNSFGKPQSLLSKPL